MMYNEQIKEDVNNFASKSNKMGDVRKCPICGAIIPAIAVECTECGYELSGVDANLSTKQLAYKIEKIQKEFNEKIDAVQGSNPDEIRQQKKRLNKEKTSMIAQTIELFPIPTTKADLFEFINALIPKIGDKKLGNAYLIKLDECITKTIILFPNDEIFVKLIAVSRQAKKEKTIRRVIKCISILFSIIIFAITTSCIVYNIISAHDRDVCAIEVRNAVSKGNLYKAEKILNKYDRNHSISIDGSELGIAVQAIIQAYLEKGDIYAAMSIVDMCYNSDSPDVAKYLIKIGRYEEAGKYMRYSNQNIAEYIYLSAKHMCQQGNIRSATEFSNKKIEYYYPSHRKYNEEKTKEIETLKKYINNMIASYK